MFPAYALAFFLAFALTYFSTPWVKKLALHFHAVDLPGERKVHEAPTPRWGGLALFFGILTSVFIVAHTSLWRVSLPELGRSEIIGIIGACSLMLGVGMMDDRWNLTAKVKLLFQIIATGWCIFHGVRITYLMNPFSHHVIYLPKVIGVLLTGLWIIGITNALNLLDGLDGLLAGISAISAVALFVVAVEKNYVMSALFLMALCGSALAFLRYNFNPAEIFLGDTGSLFLGMLWATLSIAGTLKTTTIAVFVPLLILAIPIADTLLAIFRRFGKRKPIFQPDKEHLHHQLLNRGWSQKKAVLTFYLVSGVLGIAALFINHWFK